MSAMHDDESGDDDVPGMRRPPVEVNLLCSRGMRRPIGFEVGVPLRRPPLGVHPLCSRGLKSPPLRVYPLSSWG